MFNKKGYWDGADILGIPYKYDPIPNTTEEVKNTVAMKPEYIVIHNAGSPGADDVRLNRYMAQDDYKIWHFTVDVDSITQGFAINRSGWHAGDGRLGKGNLKGIGIEIADKGSFDECMKSVENALRLVYVLKKEFPALEIQPHQFFSGKYCPMWILNNLKWSGFIAKYEALVNELEKPVEIPEPPKAPEVPEWKVSALKELHDAGIVTDFEGWLAKIDEPLPAWAGFIIMNNIRKEGKA